MVIYPCFPEARIALTLSKLTAEGEDFDTLSDHLVEWANVSKDETDAATLRLVARMICEKAIDDAAYVEIYGHLCRKLMEKIDPAISSPNSTSSITGQPIMGGNLFRSHVLNLCQEKWESSYDAQWRGGGVALFSDDYFFVEKAKRQRKALTRFMCMLFQQDMLTERVMHECIKMCLANIKTPAESDIECLCCLLMTVGGRMDTLRARDHMDVYFTRMELLLEEPNLSGCGKAMIQVSSMYRKEPDSHSSTELIC